MTPPSPLVSKIPIPVPSTPIPPLRGGSSPTQSRYELPAYKDSILPLPTPQSPDVPVGPLISIYQLPNTEKEPVDLDAIEPDWNTNFEENTTQQEGILHEVYKRPGKEYLQESPELQIQVDSKKIIQR